MVDKVYRVDASDAELIMELRGRGVEEDRPPFGSITYRYFRASDEETQKYIERSGGRRVMETREYVLGKGVDSSEFDRIAEQLKQMGCDVKIERNWFSANKIITRDPVAQKFLEESAGDRLMYRPLQDYGGKTAQFEPQKKKGEKQAVA